MVSAFRSESIRDPTDALQGLFRSYLELGSQSDSFSRFVSEHFANVFGSEHAFKEIPILNVQNQPSSYSDRSLVRFRAMVQDTSPSSEMYLSTFKNGQCGGWGIERVDDDAEEGPGGVDYDALRECAILWAVSVPGESQWCAEELDRSGAKQTRPSPDRSSPMNPEHQIRSHKFPATEMPHIGVQIKIYDTNVSESFKSTDIVTFVGILTTEALSSEFDTSIDVPTLHVLFSRPQSHLVSRLHRDTTAQEHNFETHHEGVKGESSKMARIREELVAWMADEALNGDREAAEWIVLACIARVHSRTPPLLPLSLTIARFPSPPSVPSTGPSSSSATLPVPTLSSVLEMLLPLMRTLPLSLGMLNKERFAPESKDEDLHAGLLQLPHRTTLLVTEAGVSTGKVEEQGIENIRALQEVMSAQTLAYDFPFARFSFPTDISCVVLAEGIKSAFFKTDVCMPLKPIKAGSPSAVSELYKPAENIRLPPEEKLVAFRDLIMGAWEGKVQVDEALSEHIQQDFVKDRQNDKSFTSDDLIRRMSIAKLHALSLHEPSLTIDIWERAKTLDARRAARLVSE